MKQVLLVEPIRPKSKSIPESSAKESRATVLPWLLLPSVRILAGVALTYIGVHFVKQGPFGPVKTLSQGLMMWDAVWYRWVAMYGYYIGHTRVLFPGYPLVVHTLAYLVRNYTLSALLVSWVSLIFASFGIAQLSKTLGASQKQQIIAVTSYLWFPVSAFLVAGYAESFFMAFLSWSLYFIISKRWVLASITSFWVVATRPEAVVLLLVFGIYMLANKQGLIKTGLATFTACLSLIGYMIFLKIAYNKPLDFLHETTYWDIKETFPFYAEIISIYRMATHTLTWPGHGSFFNAYSLYITDDLGAFVALGASIYCLYRATKDKRWLVPGLYGILSASIAYSFSPYGGVSPDAAARIAMSVPAIYLMISQIKPKIVASVIIVLFVVSACLWEIAFASGRWLT
jgi:hypothetical protein